MVCSVSPSNAMPSTACAGCSVALAGHEVEPPGHQLTGLDLPQQRTMPDDLDSGSNTNWMVPTARQAKTTRLVGGNAVGDRLARRGGHPESGATGDEVVLDTPA